jgi:Fe(3+) dicitrate transport protein
MRGRVRQDAWVVETWRRALGVVAIAVPLSAAAPALAQAPVQDPVTIPTIEETVNVEAIVPDEVRETPGAASLLRDTYLQVMRPYTLHDAFAFIPGVRTIDDDVLGRRSGIGVRAAPPRRSRKTLLLEDGTPINASTYLDPSGHYTPPLERLDRVEVLKGTGHVLHGPLNNHGIVNFRNKRPTATPETAVELGVGNLGTFRRHLMHRRITGPVGIVLAYTGMNAEGAFDVEDHQYDDVFASVHWSLNPRHGVGMSVTHFRERSHYDESNLTPEEFAVAPRTKRGRFGQEFNALAMNYSKIDFAHTGRLSDRVSTSAKFFLTNLDRPRFTVDPGESPIRLLPALEPESPFVPGVMGEMVGRDRHYRNVGFDSRMALAHTDGGGRTHLFQWGGRTERHRFHDRRTAGEDGELLHVGARGSRVRDDEYLGTSVSGFVQDAISIGNWRVTPGLRIEHYTQSRQALPSRDRPAGGTLEKDANVLVLPSIAVLYHHSQSTAAFASLGRGYTPAFARTAARFPLEPETGINSQVGVRSSALRGVSLEAALFHNIIHDTVVQLPFTIDRQNIFLNSEDSKSYGFDLGLRVSSSAYSARRVSAFGEVAYTLTQAAFTAGAVEGNRVPEVPLNSASFTFGVEHTAGWHASATVSYMGGFFTDPVNTRPFTLATEDGALLGPEDRFDLREPVVLGLVPSYTLLSARARYPLPGTRASIWVQGRNITDRLYILDLQNGLRPGAERTVTLGVRLSF